MLPGLWDQLRRGRPLNTLTDDLDAVIKTEATSAGFTYVDPNSTFDGHDVCARTPYVNGFGPVLSGDTRDAYHPNAAGHSSGFEPLVREALTAP